MLEALSFGEVFRLCFIPSSKHNLRAPSFKRLPPSQTGDRILHRSRAC
jgi:hypothetical protein